MCTKKFLSEIDDGWFGHDSTHVFTRQKVFYKGNDSLFLSEMSVSSDLMSVKNYDGTFLISCL
jgi:hypothetical protein